MSDTTGKGISHCLYFLNQHLLAEMSQISGQNIQTLINESIFQHSKRLLSMENIEELFDLYSQYPDQHYRLFQSKYDNK